MIAGFAVQVQFGGFAPRPPPESSRGNRSKCEYFRAGVNPLTRPARNALNSDPAIQRLLCKPRNMKGTRCTQRFP
jgi:hypothetical protein